MTDTPPGRWYRWGVLGIVMLGTFMAILDTSIVNVALPHMMSSFGANRNTIEWVATGFMLASAVAMPLMGWLASRMSYKALYLGCLLIFTASSGLCAVAWSFDALVVARVIQGVGAGAIQPIGMAIVAELFEPHERGRALGVWGTGIMVAPAIGPTLGGYLTDYFSWRTVFSVNLPIGALTLLGGMVLMRPLRAKGARRPFDFWGYVFLSMALIAGLMALSNGQEEGWGSTYIHVCEALALIGLVLFIAIEGAVRHPLVDLRLFLIRNYWVSATLAIFRSVGLFGSVFFLPIFLQRLMGYTTIQAGLWLIPGAVAVGVTMPIGGRLADRYSPGVLSAFGCVLVAGSLAMFGWLDPLSGWAVIIVPQAVRGVGLALLMAPLLTAALNAVPRHELPMASSFLNVAQRVGGSLGIALLNNLVTSSIHRHAVRLGEALPPQSAAYARFGAEMTRLVAHRSPGTLLTPQAKAGFGAARSIAQRAQVLGFQNGFVIAGLIVLLCLPLCLLLKPAAHQRRRGAAS